MESPLDYILTHSYKADMISYLKENPEEFNEAADLALSEKAPYAWRAAWVVWSCMEYNDKCIRSSLKHIVEVLPDKKDNQQRELMIVLSKMEMIEALEGQVFNHCVQVWKSVNTQVSVRYNAFVLLVKIAKHHPELKNELSFLVDDAYPESLSKTAVKFILKMMH